MSTKFLQKNWLLIVLFSLLFYQIVQAQNYYFKVPCTSKKIKIFSYHYIEKYEYQISLKHKDSIYKVLIKYPKDPVCDTVINDSVIYLWNDCGTGCISELVIFLKPKFYWNYFSDVYAVDYKNGLVARRIGNDFLKLHAQRVCDRKIIFYRTLAYKFPENCTTLGPIAFCDSLKLKNKTLTIYPNKTLDNYLTPQFRGKYVVKFKLNP